LGKVEWKGSWSSLVAFVRTQMRISKTYLGFDHVSISPAFYVRLILAKVLGEAFSHLHFRFELFLAQEYWRKCARKMLVKLTTQRTTALPCMKQKRFEVSVLTFCYVSKEFREMKCTEKINENFVMFLYYQFLIKKMYGLHFLLQLIKKVAFPFLLLNGL
jgi:hypothetical protein